MKIHPISITNTKFTGTKIPESRKIINETKQNNIELLKLTSAFQKFEEDFRTAMQTFIYMIKR